MATCHCAKDILGRGGGGGYENKLKDASFIFPMTNVTILSVFRTYAQKEYGKVWEMKNTPILNSLALLLFLKLESICSKSGLNGTQYKDKKWGEGMGGGGVESARFHGILVNRFETYFVAYYAYFTAELHQF